MKLLAQEGVAVMREIDVWCLHTMKCSLLCGLFFSLALCPRWRIKWEEKLHIRETNLWHIG